MVSYYSLNMLKQRKRQIHNLPRARTSVIVTGALNKIATVIWSRVLPKGLATQAGPGLPGWVKEWPMGQQNWGLDGQ